MTDTNVPTSSGGATIGRAADAVSDLPETMERQVEEHERTIAAFTRVGWIAKGVVYLLFGTTAIAIANQSGTDDEASPSGALGAVMDAPGGRLMIGLLAIGLILYSIWRLASVIMIRGTEIDDWLDRIGYTFSAGFYVILGWTAARSAVRNAEPDESNTVESISQSLLDTTLGRWLLGLGGLITIGIGIVFVVRKGIMRSFADDLSGVSQHASANRGIDHAIYLAGIVGWIGRGIVTAVVGFFVVRAAVRFDPAEARGFDRALRAAATTTTGSMLVWISAVGLVAYGMFCLLSHRRRSLRGQV